ncbi:Acetolactate synthase small subunit (EC 2.2.1.6) [uncultured Gammaproteobacteria bacterium]|jgi:acetolactate synthase-1/3 small subunit|uniref:acetolactate synthase small subunit n=1 Tax=thiotrophic endosymbiont of Bathymodiolus puteoserpentis (Logatchev) TaxID=343240 RepID=UPI0010B35BAF|nr:acetolactate synthase small subunit [thiotrophic endosymbiont of Bathymodiolus puteoserpentis (Logatchev)]CAC9503154.1 Acetolactate synthase small subunit (EC 2.2.1.6) [uncultured Gammaproteobacteria bacterium]CAC9579429.1 Acetolactate synthase small subunit (EC 2.2.1.6) [uncultured Gammaproteobacteria bacterium]CAC9637173.1 Acetolactate synthase small subunit (EC 2.2.1.6) [uncultured Gammaproteobacteria bacterium]CAC9987002.1 Acetolactate synthase small subunit (EC 2.2.1.6) [uncultured Gamm
MRHIISLQLENESGALSRVAGLFSARGFNIESLTVAPTNDETLSRMTIVSIGDDNIIEQIVKQLDKLIDVVTVTNLTATEHIERELVLVKIDVDSGSQAEIDKHIDEYGGKIVDVSEDTYTVEVAGKSQRVNDFLEAIDALKILEVSRTGVTGVCQKREY